MGPSVPCPLGSWRTEKDLHVYPGMTFRIGGRMTVGGTTSLCAIQGLVTPYYVAFFEHGTFSEGGPVPQVVIYSKLQEDKEMSTVRNQQSARWGLERGCGWWNWEGLGKGRAQGPMRKKEGGIEDS